MKWYDKKPILIRFIVHKDFLNILILTIKFLFQLGHPLQKPIYPCQHSKPLPNSRPLHSLHIASHTPTNSLTHTNLDSIPWKEMEIGSATTVAISTTLSGKNATDAKHRAGRSISERLQSIRTTTTKTAMKIWTRQIKISFKRKTGTQSTKLKKKISLSHRSNH